MSITIHQNVRAHSYINNLSIHRAQKMVRVAFWMQLLLLTFILRQSNELQNEVTCLEEKAEQTQQILGYRHEILVSQFYVTGLQCDIM
jgi:hypothetical protein